MQARCIRITNVVRVREWGLATTWARRSNLCQVEDKCLLLANGLSMLHRKTLLAVTFTNPFQCKDTYV